MNDPKTADEVHQKVLMLEKQTDDFRISTREDLRRIFAKLDIIHDDLITVKTLPKCADPNSCLRLEAALIDQNRRLMELEVERQKILGGKTVIVLVLVSVGWVITNLAAWFHKG